MIARALVLGMLVAMPLAGAAQAKEKDGKDRRKVVNYYDAKRNIVKRVPRWQRDTWRFLCKNRLEGRHWHVLEQDRLVAERMASDADRNEYLYAYDAGGARIRKLMADEAIKQARAARDARTAAQAAE